VARSSPVIPAVPRENSADTLAGALTPKAAIWNVMQITKIHFVTSTTLGAAQQVRALAGCTQLGGMN
jgi:hypothetical protein